MTEDWEIVAGDFGGAYKATAKGVNLSACVAKVVVWRESEALADLTVEAASGQKDVVVEDVTGFTVGEDVRIEDTTPQYEHNEIASIDVPTLTLTMVDDLSYTYTLAKSPKVLMRILIHEKPSAGMTVTYDATLVESYCYYTVLVGDFPLASAVDGKIMHYNVMVEFTKDGFKEHDLGFEWIVTPAPP